MNTNMNMNINIKIHREGTSPYSFIRLRVDGAVLSCPRHHCLPARLKIAADLFYCI
jgi:hypothetical protein